MAEVGVSVAAKLAEYLVDPTLRQLEYLFCVGKITRNVEIRKEELILKQGRVQERVQEAFNKTERIDDEVKKWKNDVKSLTAEMENLQEELGANNGCLHKWCPTWKRYCLCKKLAERTQRMIDLNTESDHFNTISHPVVVPGVGYHSSKDFTFFESTKKAYDKLWEALHDDDRYMIGLWGMGGSGKTSLVKEVGKKAEESKLFNRVIITTVSQTPNIRKIQGEIADMLGLELKEETEAGRARRIAMKLQSAEERILIILDDVWDTLNLEDIGNPFGDKGPTDCKVLLTTRRQDVCTMMDCQNTIPLGLLTEGEAWDLFQTNAKVDDGAIKVAQEVVAECKGLPIAIVAIGRCLRRKGLDEIKVVLHRLKHSKPVNEDKAFTCLKLSYDYLRMVEAKFLFLMCAVFPEDHEIIIEDLFRCGVGLGLCEDADSFEIARSQVLVAVNILIDSSLLMYSVNFENEKCVKMHDMVRDVALWIAPEENRTIMVNCAKELNKLIASEAAKNCFALSSWYENDKFLQFLSQLDAPKVEFLLLCSSATLDISPALFEGAKQLKALIIMHTYRARTELHPQPIQHLSNLRTLRLQCWNLRDISFVVSLTRLEILDLQGSKFERVPNGIEKLNKLKLLDLSKCTIEECCYKVIGMCSQLEELYIPKHYPHSKKGSCYEYLVGPTTMMKLRMYNLEIGECVEGWPLQNVGTRSLRLGQLNISMLGVIIKDLAQRATVIEFYELEGGRNSSMTNIVQAVEGMNELAKLSLKRCSTIECIMDETATHGDTIVPRLDELELSDMDDLKQLCRGHSPFTLFQKLERLKIFSCPQLLHIFPIDCNLGNLKYLKISNCPMLTYPFPASSACTLLSLETLKIRSCSELKHVLEGEVGGDAWENVRFPKLKNLSVFDCCKLEYVCPVFFAQRFVQLQSLCIKDAPQMKFVFGENAGEEQPIHDQDKTQLVLPLLEHLKLLNLPSLVGICSERYLTSWPSIKTINWRDCPNMELRELKGHQLRNDEYRLLVYIESITLHNCKAESFFHYQTGVGELIAKFQYLKELILEDCARLKFVFSAQICQSLPELTFLTISCCDELESVFSGNEEGQKSPSIAESCFLKLKSMEISECNKLEFIFSFNMIKDATSVLPQLSTLTISDCSQMEEIFKCSNIQDHDTDSEREITFLNMKEMKLKNLPRLVNVCQGFKIHTGKFCRVEVHDCPKHTPIKSATVDWTKERLERKYRLNYSQLNNKELTLNLPLSILNVGEIDIQSARVEHQWQVIGDDDPEEANDLEILRSEPQMLGGLVGTQVMRFQYLHSLEVTHIKKLKFLFSASIIVENNLRKLNSLTLSDCEELEEIFGHGDEDNANYGGTIVLSSLRKIKLRNLSNFRSVCQVGLQIQVELRHIKICNCPKFVDSSLGSALQQLDTISVSTEDSNNVETSWNVNEEKGMLLISRAEDLDLEDSMSLTSIWEGPTFIEFQNLQLLNVSKCRRLKCILPSTVMRSLPCLVVLWIEECEELEEMMSSEEEEHNHFPNNSLCFPQLRDLRVKRCWKLKWLFPSLPSTQLLPLLFGLTIKECCQLKGVWNSSKLEIHEEGLYFNTLPNLLSLTVEDCPVFSKATLAALQKSTCWNRRR